MVRQRYEQAKHASTGGERGFSVELLQVAEDPGLRAVSARGGQAEKLRGIATERAPPSQALTHRAALRG